MLKLATVQRNERHSLLKGTRRAEKVDKKNLTMHRRNVRGLILVLVWNANGVIRILFGSTNHVKYVEGLGAHLKVCSTVRRGTKLAGCLCDQIAHKASLAWLWTFLGQRLCIHLCFGTLGYIHQGSCPQHWQASGPGSNRHLDMLRDQPADSLI